MGKLTLDEALALVALIAFKDPRRHGRAGARWLRRYLEEHPDAGLDDVSFITGGLSALGGRRHASALTALQAMAGPASRTTAPREVA